MKIEAHMEKWRRFDAARGRFDPAEEFELWYWATLSGGTTIINAALHATGLTDENGYFATQILDVYAVMEDTGKWRHAIGERCDLIHVGMPPVKGPLPPALQRAFSAMDAIEHYRDPCVRGDHPITPEVTTTCDRAYAQIVAAAQAAIAEGRR
jgi:hypothetical protein